MPNGHCPCCYYENIARMVLHFIESKDLDYCYGKDQKSTDLEMAHFTERLPPVAITSKWVGLPTTFPFEIPGPITFTLLASAGTATLTCEQRSPSTN